METERFITVGNENDFLSQLGRVVHLGDREIAVFGLRIINGLRWTIKARIPKEGRSRKPSYPGTTSTIRYTIGRSSFQPASYRLRIKARFVYTDSRRGREG